MKLLTYNTSKDTSYGAVTGQGVIDLGRRLGSKYPDLKALIAGSAFGEAAKLLKEPRRTTSSPRSSSFPSSPIRARSSASASTARTTWSRPGATTPNGQPPWDPTEKGLSSTTLRLQDGGPRAHTKRRGRAEEGSS